RAAAGVGDAGRNRREDGAGVFEDVELERHGRADDGLLPLERNAQRAHPFSPVERGFFEETAPDVGHGALDGLVRTEEQGDRVLDRKSARLNSSHEWMS